MKVSFIGLGTMGFPMAGHLVKAGFDVTVFNRTHEKALAWQEQHQGAVAKSVQECAEGADVVITCVGNDDDVREMITGPNGALAVMAENTIVIDHTTTSATLAEELAAACIEKKVNFIDAPVSGGQAGAENGCLTIMCGGEQAVFDKLDSVFNAYGKSYILMGEVGQGQRSKMVNQVCIAGVLQGLSEGLLLAEKSGLDIAKLVDVLKNGAAGSWQMENRAVTMAEDKFDFGFAIDWMIKDLGICLDESQRKGLELPLAEKTNNAYKALSEEGFGRMDTSVLIKSLKK